MIERRDFHYLGELNSSDFWVPGSMEWTCLMRQEISQPGEQIDETPTRKKLKSTNRAITCTICTFLILLSLAALTYVSVGGSKQTIQPTEKEQFN